MEEKKITALEMEAFAGHLSYIIDCLPPVNGVDDVTTLKTEEEAV